jgi:hypothetical protein
MKIRRVVLTEEPYPNCIVSGEELGYYSPVYEITRDDGQVVYVSAKTFFALNKLIAA